MKSTTNKALEKVLWVIYSCDDIGQLDGAANLAQIFILAYPDQASAEEIIDSLVVKYQLLTSC